MKYSKIIRGFGFLMLGILSLSTCNVKAAGVLPGAVDNKITLTEDVTLTEKYVVPDGVKLTIDLAGYTLNGPSDNYAIDNQGDLTIIDSGVVKGSIECSAPSASCIRNGYDNAIGKVTNLKIDGVTVNGAFAVVKTEAEAITVINNSKIFSTFGESKTGAILNWGNVTINNSDISTTGRAPAIYAISGYGTGLDSKTTVNDSTLTGKYGVYSKKYDSSDQTKQYVNINGGEIKSPLSGTTRNGAATSVSGTVKANAAAFKDALNYATENTNVILTQNVSNVDATVPEGVTLTVAEGVKFTVSSNRALTVNGSLVVDGTLNASVLVTDQNKYFANLTRAAKLIGDGTSIKILKDLNETSTVAVPAKKDITIDLNGHTVVGNVTNPSSSTLRFVDNSDSKTGKVDGVVTNKGNLVITSGTYTNAPVTEDGATTNLNGGTYPIENVDAALIPENMEWVENGDGTYSISYKDADYTKVNEAIAEAEALNRDDYVDFSLVDVALEAVVTGKKVDEQDIVDSYAIAIRDAISKLEKVSHDAPLPENPNTVDVIILCVIGSLLGFMAMIGAGLSLYKRTLNDSK